MKNKIILISYICLLSGCHGVNFKEKLGIHTVGPDEFSVMPTQPLTIPPDFDLPSPIEKIQNDRANSRLSGTPSLNNSSNLSNSENILLNRADNNLKTVKKVIDNQTLHEQNNPTNPSWMDKLNFLFPKQSLGKDSSIHPSANTDSKTNTDKNISPSAKHNSSHKRICNIKQGAIVYCDDVKIIKNFPVPLE